MNGDLSVHYHVVGVLVMEHQFILRAGIVDDGMGERGSIRGQCRGKADPVFTVGCGYSFVDVHGLPAAHADEGFRDFGQRFDEFHQLVQLLVSGVAGEFDAIGFHAGILKHLGDADGKIIIEERIDDEQGGVAEGGGKLGQTVDQSRSLHIAGGRLEATAFFGFSCRHERFLLQFKYSL